MWGINLAIPGLVVQYVSHYTTASPSSSFSRAKSFLKELTPIETGSKNENERTSSHAA